MKPTLTVFTPTYNRAQTLGRTYESLVRQTCKDFEWLVIDDGSTDGTRDLVAGWIAEGKIPIRYIWKENGGLHTGYNTAIANMDTELCVCIDSDDWMPDDAVEKIITFWRKNGSEDVAGIMALDSYENGEPIGGDFPDDLKVLHIVQRDKYHHGDVKMVHRTEVLKPFVPMPTFEGERFFNPIYIFNQVDKALLMLIMNENICIVEYQDANNSMSRNIWYQYIQSPRSFAALRLQAMQHPHMSLSDKFRNAIHYVSSSILSCDKAFLSKSPAKVLTIFAIPFGIILWGVVRFKNRNRTAYN